ncbi:MAG: precorrin-8X methylmutase [Chloroflexi bacterium]|nr:precorrin-8X methylmutase [Chloroflexota bacterium]
MVEKYALLPDEIDEKSLEMVEASLPDSLDLTSDERFVVCRIVRAEGDPHIAESIRFSPGAVGRGIAALRNGAPVLTDVRMVEVGISKAMLPGLGVVTHCRIDTTEVAQRAQRESTTRSVAAIRELAPLMNGAVMAIGNAPTALLALLDLLGEGANQPAVVLGMPVGFVACAESKEELERSSVPFITIRGRRGGSSAAAAAVNAMLILAGKQAGT